MNIRSVTCFVNVDETPDAPILPRAGELARAARELYSQAGIPVQTLRVATQPLNRFIHAPAGLLSFVQGFERSCSTCGLEFRCLGAIEGAAETADLGLLDGLAAAIDSTENVFAAVQVATRTGGINLRSIYKTARVMRTLADTTPKGTGGFRFAALANCQPGVPFFPAAFAGKDEPSFSIATEAADLAVQAFSSARSLQEARQLLVDSIEREAARLQHVATEIENRFQFKFSGIDFSLSPGLEAHQSIGAALEHLTGNAFGNRMTLFATAIITECIKRARFLHAGFCGIFMPVLEDSVIAARSSENTYSIDSLLLYSTVCGTGLDNIPLPGDLSVDALAAILLDLATLAVKLDKPMTARLLPIPNAQVGDSTHFDFQPFTDARVMNSRGTMPWEWADVNGWVGFQ